MIINDKRALAYITTIKGIYPIEGYDRVEHAEVLGWRVIVSKSDNFKVGDKCVYFEVDSLCPKDDVRFSFLEKRHYKIKTIKMCGVYSQGLIMPISVFNEIDPNIAENTDVTDLLKIKYYVEEDNQRKANPNSKPTLNDKYNFLYKKKFIKKMLKYSWFRVLFYKLFGTKKKKNEKAFPTNFPYIHKTDEERIENLPHLVGYANPLIATEKLDGTSCTYILEKKKFDKYEFYVTSRNVRQITPDQSCYHESNIYWELAFKYHIEDRLKEYLNQNPELNYVCIQGEGVGNVQGNPLKLKENDLYVFNFIRSDIGRLSSIVGKNIIENMGMKWVPILDTQFKLPDTMEEIKLISDGNSVVNPNVKREGIVFRDPSNDLSFKSVSREYLLKHS
jgi:hypothetical protein